MAEGALHIGLGNPMRRDDGVGPWLVRRLAAAGCRGREWPGEASGLIELFSTEPDVVLIDACRSGRPPGSVLRIDARTTPVPRRLFHASSHEFGLAEAVEVARRLGALPPRLEVIGVEGAMFGPGEELSQPVRAAALSLEAELVRVVTAR